MGESNRSCKPSRVASSPLAFPEGGEKLHKYPEYPKYPNRGHPPLMVGGLLAGPDVKGGRETGWERGHEGKGSPSRNTKTIEPREKTA